MHYLVILVFYLYLCKFKKENKNIINSLWSDMGMPFWDRCIMYVWYG